MDWLQVFTIIVTSLCGMFYIHSDVKQQSERIDRLYEMWCETQKEIKQIYIDRK